MNNLTDNKKTEMNGLLITPDTKILEMLTAYPQLEEVLIEIAPVFIKLKNPVLRRTVARVTSIRQAAVVGGVNLSHLLVSLRTAINQDSELIINETRTENINMPEWIKTYTKRFEYDAISDIDSGIHPLTKVIAETAQLNEGEYYLLITAFIPKPLIDTLANKGFEVFNTPLDNARFGTYIKKA